MESENSRRRRPTPGNRKARTSTRITHLGDNAKKGGAADHRSVHKYCISASGGLGRYFRTALRDVGRVKNENRKAPIVGKNTPLEIIY